MACVLFVFTSGLCSACVHWWPVFCLCPMMAWVLFVFTGGLCSVCVHWWLVFCLFSLVACVLFVFTGDCVLFVFTGCLCSVWDHWWLRERLAARCYLSLVPSVLLYSFLRGNYHVKYHI